MTIRCTERHVLRVRARRTPAVICRAASTAWSAAASHGNGIVEQQVESPLNKPSTKLAVLGGGISGLAAALAFASANPKAHVTIFESSSRLGGWLKSSHFDIDGHSVIFEQGPRSLRPSYTGSSLGTLRTLQDKDLGLTILPTSKSSPAARNRFIYYPDGLSRVPNFSNGLMSVFEDLGKPLYQGIPTSILKEAFQAPRMDSVSDESVGSFLRRRLGAPLVDNLASAGLHGIYAGDIDQMSAKSLLTSLWEREQRYGSFMMSVVYQAIQKRRLMSELEMIRLDSERAYYQAFPEEIPKTLSLLKSTSVFTFQDGIEQLVKNLAKLMRTKYPNIEIKHGTSITELTPATPQPESAIRVSWSPFSNKTDSDTFTHVISALPAKPLLSALSNTETSTSVLTRAEARALSVPSVTVMVVNLYYREQRLIPQRGFGYLLPRSLTFEQNPEFTLGVVFDSDATPDLDDSPGTKVTVMLGGHWWDGWTSFPSEAEGIHMAKSLLRRQLGIVAEPALTLATLQKDCIPQYHVGHSKRLATLGDKLFDRFGSRVTLAGASWQGVSVNDCIVSGFRASSHLMSSHGKQRNPVRVDLAQRYSFEEVSTEESFTNIFENLGPRQVTESGRQG